MLFHSFFLFLPLISSISTLFGEIQIEQTLFQDAILIDSFQRLKFVDQGGPLTYFNYSSSFSRFDHSVGVWALIRLFNGTEEEQLAGLWHDISHTAFSHVADCVFKELSFKEKNLLNAFWKNPKKVMNVDKDNDEFFDNETKINKELTVDLYGEAKLHLNDPFPSYQDEIHHWFLNNSDALSVIQKYNIDIYRLSPELYPILEQDLPHMSADRIEYNLHSAYIENYLDLDDIKKIINDLRFQRKLILSDGKEYENVWFFINQVSAKKFGVLPLIFSQTVLGAPYNGVVYKLFSDLIKYCFENDIIQLEMFHFGTDLEVLEVLRSSKDDIVIETLRKFDNIFERFKITVENEDYDFEIKAKFRGIDPLVLYEGDLVHLSQLDKNFQYHFNQTRTLMKKHQIKLINN